MSLQLIVTGVIYGLSLGGIYFLVSVGLSLCFGLMRIIGLDQLLYYSLGAYGAYTVSAITGSLLLGAAAGTVMAAVVALVIERGVYRRIYDRDLMFSMITSFGILLAGIGVIKTIWGVVPRPVHMPLGRQIAILGTDIPLYRIMVIAFAALVYGGIWLFLHRTMVGKAIRAGVQNMGNVQALGINVRRLFTVTFVLAAGLSGLAGALYAPIIMVDPYMGLDLMAFVFMVVIIGGLGSIKGTLYSSLLIGQVVSLGSLIYAPLAVVAPFAIMLAILLVRPAGLFGVLGAVR